MHRAKIRNSNIEIRNKLKEMEFPKSESESQNQTSEIIETGRLSPDPI